MLEAKDYQEIAQIMKVVIENEITPKFNLIIEQMEQIQGDISEMKSMLEEHTEKLNILESWTEDAAVTIKVPYIPQK